MATGIQITPPSDITIGTTAIQNGTVGRVLFQGTGNVVQQDGAFFWDNTNKRLSVGVSTLNSGRLNVKSFGGTNTDFLIENTAGTDFTALFRADGLNIFKNLYPMIRLLETAGSTSIILAAENGFNRLETTSPFYFTNGSSGGNIHTRMLSSGFWGFGINPQAKIDVRAQGALSTDVAFRVRNSADSANLFTISGGLDSFQERFNFNGGLHINDGTYSSGIRVWFNGIQFRYGGGAYGARFEMANGFLRTNTTDSLLLGSQTSLGNGTGQLIIGNATAPNASITDSFQLYSADIVAGNAAPHFRTENGSIIKLYQQSSAGVATVADLVNILKNVGLLS